MALTRSEIDSRYRLKDLDAYRKRKREYACTPEQRKVRTEYQRRWREKNRAKHNEQANKSYHRNKHKHIERNRAQNLRYNYGLTVQEYESMLASQSGVCAVCGRAQGTRGRRLAVDHDHISGNVRGLLCSNCNGSLGWYEKYGPVIANYLIRHGLKLAK